MHDRNGKNFIDSRTALILLSTNTSKTAMEISDECNMPLSTVYRKVDKLVQYNLLRINGEIINGKRCLLFTNNAKASLFKNTSRALTILNAILHNPGLSFRDTVRMSGLTNGIVSHYLFHLEKHGFLNIKRNKRKIWLFSKDMPYDEMELVVQLRNETSHAILSHLLNTKDATFHELNRKINRSPASISIRLSKLTDEGFVKRSNDMHPRYLLKDPHFVRKTMTKLNFEDKTTGRCSNMPFRARHITKQPTSISL